MILLIDTTDFHHLHFALVKGNKISEFKKEIAFNENYKTNEFLQKFLNKQKVKPKDLTKIIVCSGPGSFTGIRVGVSMAQALGFALDIPLIALPKNKIPTDLAKLETVKITKSVQLNYGQKPNITKAKK
jgi:tRNA threonylcarbamoyladenosine biosynthesis protein TsaB